MKLEGKWDRVFAAFGGRLFTIGALLVAVAVAAIASFVAPVLFDTPATYADAHHGDIDAFIRAGEMALVGEAPDAYDKTRFTAAFADVNRGLLWFYPPHAFFAVAPLGLIDYALARPVWIAFTLSSMIGVLRLAGLHGALPIFIAVSSPAVFVSLYFLQAGAFVAIGLAASLLLAPSRPIAAGILLGLMTVKPQYGVLVPIFLAASGQWRTFSAAAVTCVLLIGLSALSFGTSSWAAYFQSIVQEQAPFYALAQPAAASAGQLILKLDAAPAVAISVQFVAIAAAATATFFAARRLDYPAAAGLTVLLSLAAAPSSWTYDWPVVAASLAMIATARGAWPISLQAIALAAWTAPLVQLLTGNTVAAPLLLLSLAVSMTTYLFKSGSRPVA